MDSVTAPVEMTPATITAAAPTRLTSKLFIQIDPTLLPQSSDGRSGSFSRGTFDANAHNSANSPTPLVPEGRPTSAGVAVVTSLSFTRLHPSATVASGSPTERQRTALLSSQFIVTSSRNGATSA